MKIYIYIHNEKISQISNVCFVAIKCVSLSTQSSVNKLMHLVILLLVFLSETIMWKQDLLVYDKTWGGVVTKDGLNDRNADFGNAWYNDHTYHYGYLLYAAAVLIKFHPAFYGAHKDQLDFLVADVVGGEGDMAQLFPSARQKVYVHCRLIPPPSPNRL